MSLEDYQWDVYNCVRCSNCKWLPSYAIKKIEYSRICPSITRYLFDAYSSQGRLDLARVLLHGELRWEDSPKILDIIYKCTLCGGCDIMCKNCNDLEPLAVLEELRAKCFEDGVAPLPAHKAIIDSLKNYSNVWLQPRTRRDAWAKGLKLRDASKEQCQVLYFVGCTYSYKPDLYHIPQNTVKILNKAGINFGILGKKEPCCTSPALRVGDRRTSEEIIVKNVDMFNALGVETIITSCAGCYSTLKSDYPGTAKPAYRVLHTIEYIDQLIQEGKLAFSKTLPLEITYHDPCHLGRRGEPHLAWKGIRERFGIYNPPKDLRRGNLGIYDPPRRVLQSIPGITLIEMDRIREYSWCCGSGGGVKSAYPDFAVWAAKERVKEALSTKVKTLATCCPWCESNLQDGNSELGNPMDVVDITKLIEKVL